MEELFSCSCLHSRGLSVLLGVGWLHDADRSEAEYAIHKIPAKCGDFHAVNSDSMTGRETTVAILKHGPTFFSCFPTDRRGPPLNLGSVRPFGHWSIAEVMLLQFPGPGLRHFPSLEPSHHDVRSQCHSERPPEVVLAGAQQGPICHSPQWGR